MREKHSLRINFVNFLARNYFGELRTHPVVAFLAHSLLLVGFVFLTIWISLIVAAVVYVLLAISTLLAIYIAVKFSSKAVTEQTTNIDQRLETVTEQTETLQQNSDSAIVKTNGRSRSVSPVMPSSDISALVNEVGPKIGLSFNANQINYLSARVLVADEKIRGRIACTVQTQVLRNMCCLSLTSDTLNVLEIGTLFGGAVVSMFGATYGHFSKTYFTMVDPLDGYYQNGADPLTGVPVNESVLHANMIAGGVARENYRLIKGRSEDPDILKMASSKVYDLLLIDGDHGFEGLRSDFVNYVPLVKKGGLVLIDDYGNESWPDVKKFIDEELQNSSHLEMITAIFDTAVLRVTSENH